MPIFVDRIVDNLRDRYNIATSTINRQIVLNYSALIGIFIVAYFIRIFSAFRYEIILSANDPYAQFRATSYIAENGLFSFLSWFDPQTWYPEGRPWGKNLYLGTPVSAVLIYQFFGLIGLNIPLEVVCYYHPALLGSLTCVAIYFLGKELANKKVGLLSALFLAVSGGHLQRTVVGFFDNEAVGILFLVLALYFYARALRTGSVTSTILAGICLGILSGSWGASTYVFNLLAIHALVLLVTKKHSSRLFLAYGGSIIIGFIIMIFIPRNGPGSILTTDGLAPLGVLGLVALAELYRYVGTFYDTQQVRDRVRDNFIVILPIILIISIIGIIALFVSGLMGNIPSKFVTTILPFFRDETPILKSVSEHQLVVWSTFYRNIGILVFFIPLSIYYLYEKPTEGNILLLLFGLTAIYFAGSMVRLALILAPASALLVAKAIDQTLLPFVLTFQERFALTRRKTRITQPLSNELTAIAFAFIGIFLLLSVWMATDTASKSASAPSILTIVPAPGQQSLTIGNDWQEAIGWLDYHTTSRDVVASWWDYGYWISGNSNTTILVDNSTHNSTKIANIGCMLVLNPRESLKIAKIYDVTYIVLLVSDGWGALGLDSDLGKVPWFVRIGEQSGSIVQIDQDEYLEYDSRNQYITGYVNKFYQSVFWALFTSEVKTETFDRIKSYQPIKDHAPENPGFPTEYAEYTDYYELAYKTKHDWIFIWRIKWDIIPPEAIAP